MDPNSQVLLSVGVPTIAVLVGILINNRQIDSLRGEIRDKFASLDRQLDARFQAANEALLRVEGVLDARLKHLEDRAH